MKRSKKVVTFSLTMPKTDVAFTTLRTSLKRFGNERQAFESLGCRVEVVGIKG
jgi:hypothetical protein